jgi:adenosine deaminase
MLVPGNRYFALSYYQGSEVLRQEDDFVALTWDYLNKAAEQNVRHTELFFDPQSHAERGVAFSTVISGITAALEQARSELNITSRLIMCLLRHLSAESALETLGQALPFKDQIVGVGLDSSESGNPPSKFQAVFDACRK